MPYTPEELKTLGYAENLAKSLIREHLGVLFRFKWNNRKSSFGLCDYTNRTIQLSRIMTANQCKEQIRDTILHEIAHALTPGAGHGPAWKRKARELGCVPRSTGRVSAPGRERLNSIAPWALMFNDELIRVYYKRPSRTMEKLDNMYMPGRMAETYGKLRIVPNPQFKK